MNNKELILALAFLCLSAMPASAAWKVSGASDKMSGEKEFFATSEVASPLTPMSRPYNGVKAWVGVGCRKDSMWSYLGFSKSPNLIDKSTKGGYSTINARIKWDSSLETMKFTQDWGSRFLNFEMDELAVKKLKNYKTFMVELNWYGNEGTVFEFDLSGSSTAINEIAQKCGMIISEISFEDKFKEAQSKMSFSSTYRIYASGNAVEIRTEGNNWKPFARDSSATERIESAIVLINEVARQFDENYKLSIEVFGSTTLVKCSSDGASPFRGDKLKNLVEKAIRSSEIDQKRIEGIIVNDRDPDLYGNDAPSILIGRVKNTNEMVRFNVELEE